MAILCSCEGHLKSLETSFSYAETPLFYEAKARTMQQSHLMDGGEPSQVSKIRALHDQLEQQSLLISTKAGINPA